MTENTPGEIDQDAIHRAALGLILAAIDTEFLQLEVDHLKQDPILAGQVAITLAVFAATVARHAAEQLTGTDSAETARALVRFWLSIPAPDNDESPPPPEG